MVPKVKVRGHGGKSVDVREFGRESVNVSVKSYLGSCCESATVGWSVRVLRGKGGAFL